MLSEKVRQTNSKIKIGGKSLWLSMMFDENKKNYFVTLISTMNTKLSNVLNVLLKENARHFWRDLVPFL